MTFQSLKQRILAMPAEEQARWRAYYSDEEWMSSWDLIGFPFQLPPIGHWTSWTILGGRGVGKTTAGLRWAVDTFMEDHNVLGIFHHPPSMMLVFKKLWQFLQDSGTHPNVEASVIHSEQQARLRDKITGTQLTFITERDALSQRGAYGYEYLWADEISDAGQIRQLFPRAQQYVFTQPVKLDPDTVISRAGDARS